MRVLVEASGTRIVSRQRGQHPPGVVMAGISQNLTGQTLFQDAALTNHGNRVRHGPVHGPVPVPVPVPVRVHGPAPVRVPVRGPIHQGCPVMSNRQHRQTAVRQIAQHPPNQARQLWIEPCRHFVGNQHRGLTRQRQRQTGPRQHPSGQLVRIRL